MDSLDQAINASRGNNTEMRTRITLMKEGDCNGWARGR